MIGTNGLGEDESPWTCLETHPFQELWESDNYMQSGRSMTSQPLMERSRQVMTFLTAPDQKVALLVIPGWPDALPALPCSWCSGAPRSPQEPKQSLLMVADNCRTSYLHYIPL